MCDFLYNGKWYTEAKLKDLFESFEADITEDTDLQSSNPLDDVKESKGQEYVPENLTHLKELSVVYNQLTSELVQEADTQLNQRLIDFLKPLGISVEMVENMKERTGVDALGAANILNKVIAVSKNKSKLDTLPEETAHFFIELLGRQNPTLKSLIRNIHTWEGYEKVKSEYSSIYNNDDYKIRKEAAGKLVGEYIVGHRNASSSMLEEIKKMIMDILNFFSIDFFDPQSIAEDIAVDILTKNYTKIKGKLQPGARLVNYEDTLEKNQLMKHISARLRKLGFYLTGSLALRKQGTVYRPKDEDLHDLDFKVPPHLKNTWRELVRDEFNIIGKFPVAYEFKSRGMDVTALNLHGVVVDFFQEEETTSNVVDNIVSWQEIFKAKLDIGRQKDLTDFLAFTPNETDKSFDNSSTYFQKKGTEGSKASPATIAKVKEFLKRIGVTIEGVKQLMTSDNSQANAMALETLIRIVQGKEDVALTEEAIAAATSLSEEKFNELNSFEMFEDEEKLCPSGICNYTAQKSTEQLKKAGLNPYPNAGGSSIGVTVKSPLGAFDIGHYVAATALGEGVYIYDMPQHEFLSEDVYGMGSVPVKTSYKPRFIPLTKDEIKSNYNLTDEESLNFIRQVLDKGGYNAGQSDGAPPFEDYIRMNVRDGQNYIDQLRSEIKDSGVTSIFEKWLVENDQYGVESMNAFIEKLKGARLSAKDTKKVLNLLETKLKLRTREYIPKTKQSFILKDLIYNIIGNNSFKYDPTKGLPTALEEFDSYLKSDRFLKSIWSNYVQSKNSLRLIDNTLDSAFSNRRLMMGFLKNARVIGFDKALSEYDSKQRYNIRHVLPDHIRTTYKSESQMIFMLSKQFSNINSSIPDVMGLIMDKDKISSLYLSKFKAAKQLEKSKTLLNFLKEAEFDPSYIHQVISNEAQRQYSYFQKVNTQSAINWWEEPGFKERNPNFDHTAYLNTVNKFGKTFDNLPEDLKATEDLESDNTEEGNLMFQLKGTEGSKASPATIAKIKEFLKRIGVSIEGVKQLMTTDNKQANAMALEQLIRVVQGKEDIALTEEAMHFAVELIEDLDPKLFMKMLSSIGNYDIYQQVLEDYRNTYLTKEGKPDIRKIKKEAIGKVLAEVFILKSEGSTEKPELLMNTRTWWQQIIDSLRKFFGKSNINPFEKAVEAIVQGDIEGQGYIVDAYFQKRDDIESKLKTTTETVIKVYKPNADPDNPLADDSDVSNWYEIDGREVLRRVTNRVKAWYKKRFGNRNRTDDEKTYDELKRSTGIMGHLDFENILNRYIDKDTHELRSVVGPREPSVIGNEAIYEKIDQYVQDLIAHIEAKDPGSKYYIEQVIYDKKNDEAGTIDLLVLSPDGEASLYDWKFMVVAKQYNDVPWFKQNAFGIQIDTYKKILKEQYGITQFKETRAVPILMNFNPPALGTLIKDWKVTGIGIGNPDIHKITDFKLVPVLVGEKVGIPAIDKIINQLNALYKKESSKKVTEHRKDIKTNKMNAIFNAIRQLQTQQNLLPLMDTIDALIQDINRTIIKYQSTFKDGDINSISNDDISEMAGRLLDLVSSASVYENMDSELDHLFDESNEEHKETKARFKEMVSNLRIKKHIIDSEEGIARHFTDKYIGEKNGVSGLLKAQKIVKGIASNFRGMSELGLKSLDLLYRVASDAQEKARKDALDVNEEILSIRTKVLKWAENKGIKPTEIFNFLYQKDDKGRRIHRLIDQIRPDFFTTLREKADAPEVDIQWFKDNFDFDAYRVEIKDYLARRRAEIETFIYSSNKIETTQRKAQDLHNLEVRYDIDSNKFTGWSNSILKRHIKNPENHYSEEYKKILNTPLKELYDIHLKLNKLAAQTGYIEALQQRHFTPFLKKGIVDKIFWGGNKTKVQDFIDELSASDPNAYGAKDPITGELINTIPKFYTTNIGKETSEIDEKGNPVIDYIDVSEDMFKNLIAYSSQLHKYKYLSEIEEQIEMVKHIEGLKGHLNTNTHNQVVFDNENEPEELPGNDQNALLFDRFMKTILYGQKYTIGDSDSPLGVGKAVNFMRGIVNKVAGREVFKINSDVNPPSMVKTIEATNRFYQIKTLGLSPLSGLATWFGNNIQISAQSGKYFDTREFLANELKLTTKRFSTGERDKFIKILETFLPLRHDISEDLKKKAGVKKLTDRSFSDWLMIMMRKPDELMEKSVFLSLLDNMMVEDGKIINIKDHVKDKYAGLRNSSGAEYRRTRPLIEREISELKKTRSISKISTLSKEGELIIPGLDLTNDREIVRLSQLAKNLSKNATGNISNLDMNQMQMNIFTRSMMVFRNWIPKLIDTRFGELKRTADNFEGESYDIGRIRLMFKALGNTISGKAGGIYGILTMSDKGIEGLNRMFDEMADAYRKRTGEDFEMSRDEFFDLIHQNIYNEAKELGILLSLMGAMLGLGYLKPADDDDPRAKNFYKVSKRIFDKMKDELSFFYNPVNFQQMLSGGIFPALGVFRDIEKFTIHFGREIMGDSDKAQPLKHLAKMVPGVNAWVTYVGLISPELAKEMDIVIPSESNLR